MARYIDAEALINALEKRRIVIQRYTTAESALQTQGRIFREEIENAPTVDVVPMEEVKRLHTSCTELAQCCTKFETLYKIECKRVDTIKADTVREMRDRLLEWGYLGYDADDAMKAIREVAKEMLEDST